MIVDIIIGLLIGLGVFYGYRKGLLIELITLLAFIIAIISAFKLLHTTLGFLKQYVTAGSFAVVLSFILVFTIVFVLIFMLGKLLKNTIDYTFFGIFDKIAGGIMGGLKAAFSISMILWLCHNAHIDTLYNGYTKGAYIYPYILAFGPEFVHWISYVIPFQDIFPAIKKTLHQ